MNKHTERYYNETLLTIEKRELATVIAKAMTNYCNKYFKSHNISFSVSSAGPGARDLFEINVRFANNDEAWKGTDFWTGFASCLHEQYKELF